MTSGRPALPFLVLLSLVLLSLSAIGCGGATTPIAPTVVAAAAQAPANGGIPRWSLSGTVRDKDDGSVLEGVSVRIIDQFEPRQTVTDAAGRYRFDAVAEWGVRVTFGRDGYRGLTLEQVVPTENLVLNVSLFRDCDRPWPVQLSYTVSGRTVTFTRTSVDGAIDYRLSVGQWDYVSPVFSTTMTETSYQWMDAPSGTYHAQVQGRNDCGLGNAANHLKVIVP